MSTRFNLSRFRTYKGYYSLVGRDFERELVPMPERERLGLVVLSPLAGGYLSAAD